jgi:hypothetical protein
MRRWLSRALVIAVTAALTSGVGAAQAAQKEADTAPQQVPVASPPMGWASWNAFAAKVDAKTIEAQADALVSSGLAAAGYDHVNIDEGWWQGTRDADGNITVDETEWPGGMKAVADYIHSKGLKAGIYTDAGKDGCGYYYPTGRVAAPGSGSEGHYDQDFLQFSQWGFDFVKVDWCGGAAENIDPAAAYQAISSSVAKATAATGRELVLSICNWGRNNPWNWAPGVGRMWRTSDDIITFQSTASATDTPVLWPATLGQVLTNFDKAQHPAAQHTGYVNDPDMLTVGLPGLTDDQARTEMSLWAVSGAPLMAGNILTSMTDATATVFKNREVIAVDQDPRGMPAVKLTEAQPGLQVYTKVLAGQGRRAVVLLNRNSAAASMTVKWSDLGLAAGNASVRDVWAGTDLGSLADYTVTVPANGSVMLTVTGTEGQSVGYPATGAAGATSFSFNAVGGRATGPAVLDVTYTNATTAARSATLTVNGQVATAVALPPTGDRPGTVSAVVSLRRGSVNTVTLAGAAGIAAVSAAPIPGAAGIQVVGGQSQRCLDIFNNSIDTGTDAELWDCTGGTNQSWTYGTNKTLMVYGSRCIDAWGEGRTDGTRVALWYCTGNANQLWNVNADGTITGVQSGLCLDARNGTGNGTHLVLGTCNGSAGQQWSVDPAAPADVAPPSGTFTLSTAKAWPGQKVTLTQQSLSDDVSAPGAITRSVDWGDGSAPGTDLTHVYAKPGNFQVAVTLTDESGKSAPATIPGAGVAVAAPAGTFKLSKTSVWPGEKFTVSWTGLSPDATKVSLDLGNGSRVVLPRTTNHLDVTYKASTAPGNITLYATFTNGNGDSTPVAVGALTLKRDSWRPTVAITKPARPARASSWGYARGTVADKGAGVAGVALRISMTRGGTLYCYTAAQTWKRASSCAAVPAAVAGGKWSLRLKGVGKGVLDVTAVATDKAALTSTAAHVRQKITG